jgi:peptide chain release factor 3
MKVRQVRTGRDLKLANALTFMANERVASEDAVAGDIIGITTTASCRSATR